MGGMIGMTYALKYPGTFKSLVLCDTSSRIPPEARPVWEERIQTATQSGMEPLVEPTLKRWFTEPFLAKHPPVVERVARMIRSTPAIGYAGCCHAIPKIDVTDRLKEIACPARVIVGEQGCRHAGRHVAQPSRRRFPVPISSFFPALHICPTWSNRRVSIRRCRSSLRACVETDHRANRHDRLSPGQTPRSIALAPSNTSQLWRP